MIPTFMFHPAALIASPEQQLSSFPIAHIDPNKTPDHCIFTILMATLYFIYLALEPKLSVLKCLENGGLSMHNISTFLVTGIVQGVGFRPFCARLAEDMGLGGSVKNTSDGVVIKLQGSQTQIEAYLQRLQKEKPEASHISSIDLLFQEDSCEEKGNFVIEKVCVLNINGRYTSDIATCNDCLREMRDPSNRRYRYPFINCTNCGP